MDIDNLTKTLSESYSSTVIGYGNMGTALVKYLVRNKVKVKIGTRNPEKVKLINKEFRTNIATTDNIKAIEGNKMIFICVKPNVVEKICREIADFIDPNSIVISLAATIKIKTLKLWLNRKDLKLINVVRAMPTISISEGFGIFPYIIDSGLKCKNDIVLKLHRLLQEDNCSVFEVKSEKELEQLTIFSACGIAYLAKIMQCYIKASSSLEMNPILAKNVIIPMIDGISAKSKSFGEFGVDELVDEVASKGGITEASIKELDVNQMVSNMENMFGSANNQLKSLSKQFNA